MGQTDPGQPGPAHGRKLSVIYFVDSAKTKSISVSLVRLNVILTLVGALLLWSVASIVVLAWVIRDRQAVSMRLKTALATVFTYETRDDDVYGMAYPQGAKQPPSPAVASVKPAGRQAKPHKVAAQPVAKVEHASSKAAKAPKAVARTSARPEKGLASTHAGVSATPAEGAIQVNPKRLETTAEAQPLPNQVPDISITNPVIQAAGATIELRFAIGNKSGKSRVEGYLWAVAEFRTDKGERLYIGAPSAIQVGPGGEPRQPLNSIYFSIHRYKKKSFVFPLIKDRVGTFTSVRIGVMDRSGVRKMTYDIPAGIRIGKSDVHGGKPSAAAAEKPG